MKEFGKYIRLDSWKEAEGLGLEEGFKGYSTDLSNMVLKAKPYEDIHKSGDGIFPFVTTHIGRACKHAYVLKNSLPSPKKQKDSKK